MKKQVGIIVSIALTSFLVGALFNFTAIAGKEQSPFEQIWMAISELQERVSALEEDTSLFGKIPFNGMTISYLFYDNYQVQSESSTGSVTFYADSSEPDYIWVTGFTGMFSPDRTQLSVDTRKIFGEESYSRYLFPTDIQVGDEVITNWWNPSNTVTIIGNQTISVMGKQVDAWIAYSDPGWGQYTMYYEMKTGILLGGTFVYDSVVPPYSRSIYLVSTNAPI